MYSIPELAGGCQRRVKIKSYLMERFFGESDDTLHKRRLPIEEASPACPCPSTPYLATHSCNSKHSPSLLPSPTSASSSLVHRLTIQTSSLFNPAGWRVVRFPNPLASGSGLGALHNALKTG